MFTFILNALTLGDIATIDLVFKAITGITAFILFVIGFSRYRRDQLWKRSEFVAKEVKEFNADKMVRSTMFMLDWGTRKIELFPDKPDYNERFVVVDREMFRNALVYHERRQKEAGKMRFTETEVAIRDHMDQFFSYFERFEQLIQAGLMTRDEISPYIAYWIEAIAVRIEKDTGDILFEFIDKYNYRGTQRLFARFGVQIVPATDAVAQ